MDRISNILPCVRRRVGRNYLFVGDFILKYFFFTFDLTKYRYNNLFIPIFLFLCIMTFVFRQLRTNGGNK